MLRALGISLLLGCAAAVPAAAEGPGYRFVGIDASGLHRRTLIRNQQVRVLDIGPSRQRIVFSRPATGLYTSRLNGKDSQLILALGGSTVPEAAWSPDGAQIAFTVFGKLPIDSASCGISVWTIYSDGERPRKIADCAALQINTAVPPAPWTRDGRRLAFLGSLAGTARTSGVLTVATLGGRIEQFGDVESIREIAMSPAGDWLAFDRANQEGTRSQLKLMRLRDGALFALTKAVAPVWSHHGRRLSVGRQSSGRFGVVARLGIVAVGERPSAPRWLPKVRGGALATWSRSDRRIAYVGFGCRPVSIRCVSDPQIYTLDVRTRAIRRVTHEEDWGVIDFAHVWWNSRSTGVFFTRARSGAGD